MKYLGALLLLPLSFTAILAQNTHPIAVREFPQYQLIKGNVDSNGLPTSGAKLCLTGSDATCFQMPSMKPDEKSGVVYEFGAEPHAQRLPLSSGGSLVLFSAQFYGGGSGTLDRLTILRYDGTGRVVNLLPRVGMTNQSEYAIWSLPNIAPLPVLMTADFVWRFEDKETHFAKHFYTVSAYRFDRLQDRYVEAFSYQTSKKYVGLDEVDQVRVLDPERNEIMRRLRASSVARP